MKITKHQQGGAMPPAQAAPQEDPMAVIIEMAMQALQTQDPAMALKVCEGLLMLVQGAQPAPVGAPAGGEPVFKQGGKIVARKPKLNTK